MASSDNLATFEPWMFRSTIADSWIPDAFARETESALTKALQHSFTQSDVVSPFSSSFFAKTSLDYCSTTASASTVTVSGSGSEPETPGSKRRVTGLGVTGKTVKRKSRASKPSRTTFIQADPANFRQMVQQVTGVKFDGNGQLPVSTLVKSEAHRQPFINRLQGLLPTLDTSAYLLDHQTNSHNNSHRQMAVSGSTSTGFSQPPATNPVDFESYCSFPTLESWN